MKHFQPFFIRLFSPVFTLPLTAAGHLLKGFHNQHCERYIYKYIYIYVCVLWHCQCQGKEHAGVWTKRTRNLWRSSTKATHLVAPSATGASVSAIVMSVRQGQNTSGGLREWASGAHSVPLTPASLTFSLCNLKCQPPAATTMHMHSK